MIVTIDGPAGAGKSTVARRLAERLGFRYLDTGAMYRAVALAALRQGLPWDQPEAIAALCSTLQLELKDGRIFLDGEDVTEAVRASEVTAVTRYAADNPQVRHHLVELQRAAAAGADVITEGRDQGTVAFPDAQCKFYLTASPLERAKRRVADLQVRGERPALDEILKQQSLRDRRDASRSVGPLRPADDAIHIDTDGRTIEQVLDELERIVRSRLSDHKAGGPRQKAAP